MGARIDARPAIEGEEFSRVALSPEATALLRTLWERHGPLMFHQSGGCCDGSSPMCFPEGDFKTGGSDVLLGVFDLPLDGGPAHEEPVDDDGAASVGQIGFWMSREQFEYWKHTHLTVDVVPGRGSGFSVEAPEGKRFLIRSRIIG
ncbi:DUF779 domain-containing protein [Arthrobacter ginkgonis]|uniref:DUF779 domain-containing protein n=1 Tax=Arthrobacter ginkgonis TaxID=1630594 RepID=A0ABP7CBI9_9MICC